MGRRGYFQTMKQSASKQSSYLTFPTFGVQSYNKKFIFPSKTCTFFIYTRKKPPSAMLKEVFS